MTTECFVGENHENVSAFKMYVLSYFLVFFLMVCIQQRIRNTNFISNLVKCLPKSQLCRNLRNSFLKIHQLFIKISNSSLSIEIIFNNINSSSMTADMLYIRSDRIVKLDLIDEQTWVSVFLRPLLCRRGRGRIQINASSDMNTADTKCVPTIDWQPSRHLLIGMTVSCRQHNYTIEGLRYPYCQTL